MSQISKTLKTKTAKAKTAKAKIIVPKKKVTQVKAKSVPIKKVVAKKIVTKKLKKTFLKKIKKITPKKSNRITIDVISDEKIFPGYSTKESIPIFSAWPDFSKVGEFKKKIEVEDIYRETEETEKKSKEPNKKETNLVDREDYDKQKKFFSDWATQIKPKDGEEKPKLAPQKKSIGLYRRQAFFYLGATAVLLLAVFYLFFSNLTILISPQGETLNDFLAFNIIGANASTTVSSTTLTTDAKYNKTIDGEVKIVEVSAEKIYQTSGEEILGEEVIGTVTLTNKSNKAQPLVVKTRLLSPDGKLFRLKEAVNIPAGGTVKASVYADKPSAEMAITQATHFVVPGLWAGLQDRIYAENSEPFIYQTQVKKYIKQRDLDQARKDINEVLNLKVKNELKVTEADKIIVYSDNTETISTEVNAKLGDEKADFIVKASKKVTVATFSNEKVAALAEARLSLLVPDDKQLSNFNKNKITYSLESFDPVTKIAIIKAYFNGVMSLKSDATLIDRHKLIGLNRLQISEYLNSFPEIKSYELHFSPTFIATAPTLPDRINIKIQN